MDRAGASAISRRGEIASRAEPPTLSGMEVAALPFVEDDFVFAYQHVARLVRVTV